MAALRQGPGRCVIGLCDHRTSECLVLFIDKDANISTRELTTADQRTIVDAEGIEALIERTVCYVEKSNKVETWVVLYCLLCSREYDSGHSSGTIHPWRAHPDNIGSYLQAPYGEKIKELVSAHNQVIVDFLKEQERLALLRERARDAAAAGAPAQRGAAAAGGSSSSSGIIGMGAAPIGAAPIGTDQKRKLLEEATRLEQMAKRLRELAS